MGYLEERSDPVPKHQVIDAYRNVEVKLHAIWILVLGGGERLTSRSGRFNPSSGKSPGIDETKIGRVPESLHVVAEKMTHAIP